VRPYKQSAIGLSHHHYSVPHQPAGFFSDEPSGKQGDQMVTEKAEKIAGGDSLGHLPSKPRPTVVSDELTKVMALVTEGLPGDTKVSFQFDGKLHVMIDVRTLEQVLAVEMTLPKLGAGMFHDIQRVQAPRHGFGHRVTALVDR